MALRRPLYLASSGRFAEASDADTLVGTASEQYVNERAGYPAAEHSPLLAWSQDPAACATTAQASSGRLLIARVFLPTTEPVARIYWAMTTACATPGTYSGVAMYSDAGARLGSSANAGTSFTSTGLKSALLSSPVTPAEPMWAYLSVLWNGTTAGAYLAGGTAHVATLPGTPRQRAYTGQTSFPASIDVDPPGNFGFTTFLAAASS